MGISTSSVFSRPDMGMRFYFAITTDNVAGGAMTKYFRALTWRDHISAPPRVVKENFVIKKIIQKNTLSKVVPIRV